jgi:hypothetical protein
MDRPMKTISLVLSLAVLLAAASLAGAEEFTSDKRTPLKVVRAAGGEEAIVRFSGTVRISGRFLAAWEGFNRTPRYLRVTFRPDSAAAALLPHALGAGAVEELMLTNNDEAAAMLLRPDAAEKLLAKALASAEGEATVTIGEYQTVVECDHRWYMARLVAVATSRDLVAAAGESRRPAAC